MALTPAEQTQLKTAILAEPSLADEVAANAYFAIWTWLQGPSTFIVWRTSVPESDFTDLTSAEATTWSWPAFIARSVGEQTGWSRMFQTGSVNPSRANVRQAFLDIFSGSANSAPAQRAHCAAIAKRAATLAEKVFATGTGTTASPGMLTKEGSFLELVDVENALRS